MSLEKYRNRNNSPPIVGVMYEIFQVLFVKEIKER